jgi:hypothetical protein
LADLQKVNFSGTHRLIPAKYSVRESVLENLPLSPKVLSDLGEIEAATDERKMAERGSTLGRIGPQELIYGIPDAHIVNAAFTHPGPHGGRFNDSNRGAWYAAVEFDTSVAEVSFHRRRLFQDVRDERFRGRYSFDYVDFVADFAGMFHHLDSRERKDCLQPAPIPECYRAPQALAGALLRSGSTGIVYPSVRSSGMCIACFRPVLVTHLRRDHAYRITVETKTDQVTVKLARAVGFAGV